jgi:hypothetical protein
MAADSDAAGAAIEVALSGATSVATGGPVGWIDMFDDKLREARFFLEHMRAVANDREPWPFTYHLRAFLAAMRSATSYAQTAAERRSRKRDWYDLHDADRLRKFLRELRDENLHVRPVHPQRTVHATISLMVSGYIAAAGYKSEENGVRLAPPTFTAHARPRAERVEGAITTRPTATRTVVYRFPLWDGPGSNEVLDLCTRYVASVEQLLSDAAAAGIIAR